MNWLYALNTLLGCSEVKGTDQDVDDNPILGIVVTPDDLILPINGTSQLQATGLYSDRTTVDLTSSVSWFVELYVVLEVSESLDSEGQITAISEGVSRVYAEYEGIKSNYADVMVTAASIDRISIVPNELELVDGDQVQLQAAATFSNGESGDFTQLVRWITDDGGIVQFDTNGLLLAVGDGETDITAVYEDISSDPVEVEVVPYYEGGKPDLRITEATMEDDYSTRTIRYTIVNQGSKSAIGFWVDIFNGGAQPNIDDVGVDYHWVEYLGPNHVTTKAFEIPLASAFPTPWLMVDTANDIEESHENNNTFQVTGTGDSSQAADLYISYFDIYELEGQFEVLINITNQGQQTADYFFVDLFHNQSNAPNFYDDGEQYLAIESLGPGATDFADFTITNCFNCEAWVLVDGYESVLESNESNNTAGPISYSSN